MRLTQEQVDSFNRDGFLIIREFLEYRECDIIKEIAQIHIKYQIEPIEMEWEYIGRDRERYNSVRRIRQVYDRDIIFKRWMENLEIRPILKQLLNDTPVLTLAHHNSIMSKMPHTSSETKWHRDIRYWSYENSNLISVWLALGDEHPQNGLLEFIPASHKAIFNKDSFDEKSYFRDDYPPNQEWISKRVSNSLKKGDIILFHAMTLHRANPNMTNEPKISFVYTVKGQGNRAIQGTRSAEYREIVLDC